VAPIVSKMRAASGGKVEVEFAPDVHEDCCLHLSLALGGNRVPASERLPGSEQAIRD
jgi:hypothetical protein